MPYTTLVSGTTITASWANANVRDQVVTPFATAAARTSAISAPIEGMLTYRVDGHSFEGWDGVAYVQLPYVVHKYKTVDETVNNSTTLQNDDHLAWPVTANAVYALELHLVPNSGTSADFKLAWTFPVGLTMDWSVQTFDAGSVWVTNGGFVQTTVVVVGGTAGDSQTAFYGMVYVGANTGTLQLQWAQNAAFVADTIVRKGSWGRLTRIV